eukprot:gene15845-biopygen14289
MKTSTHQHLGPSTGTRSSVTGSWCTEWRCGGLWTAFHSRVGAKRCVSPPPIPQRRPERHEGVACRLSRRLRRVAAAAAVEEPFGTCGERQRTPTGRGPHDRIKRNGRGPDAGTSVSPRGREHFDNREPEAWRFDYDFV